MDTLAYLAVALSVLGDDLVYLALAFTLLTIRRDLGTKLTTLLLVSMIVNQVIKYSLNVPRPPTYHQIIDYLPWYIKLLVLGEGPSLPSGHTQVSATFWLSLPLTTRKPLLYLPAATFPPLVAYSRLVLGVHTVVDVAVALILGYTIPVAYRILGTYGRLVRWRLALAPTTLSIILTTLLYLAYVLDCTGLPILAGFLTAVVASIGICDVVTGISRKLTVASLTLATVCLAYLIATLPTPVLPNKLLSIAYSYMVSVALTYLALVLIPLMSRVARRC